MIDRSWAKILIEAARSILWTDGESASDISADELIALAGVRPPRTEAERLILLGIACDVRGKLGDVNGLHAEGRIVGRVLAYLRGHSRDPHLSRRNVARAFGVSDSWLAHNLKRTSGQSFTEHLNRIRFDDACVQLQESSKSIKHAALTAGFPSAGAGAKQFERRLGMSPTQWRKQSDPGPKKAV